MPETEGRGEANASPSSNLARLLKLRKYYFTIQQFSFWLNDRLVTAFGEAKLRG
jgi:hypothetical protein